MNKPLDILLRKYGKKMVMTLKRQLRVDKSVASGDTLESIKYDVKGSSLNISYDATLGVIDEGLNPRKSSPSSVDILAWMKAKNIRPRDTRKGVSTFVKSSKRNMKSSAYAISRAIAEKGTSKRFGYHGSSVLDFIRVGSDLEKEFVNELLNTYEGVVDFAFEQNKDLPIRNSDRF